MAEAGRICVTGAGGFVASWAVKLLLSQNYVVHGTVRGPGDEKNAHLKKLDKAPENLKLFKAELLDYDSLFASIKGCDGVFHVASPVPSTSVPNPEARIVELIQPAANGTLNVLKACSEAGIKRVIYVSSGAAVSLNPSWPKGQVKDESCWSDKDYCRATNNWYCLSKTEAESKAFEYAKGSGLDVVSVCPTLVFGPMLQSTINSSSLVLIKLLKEGYTSLENKLRMTVDVRDVAEALLLVYNKPEAEGRYICTAHMVKAQELVEKLKSIYPDYNYPKRQVIPSAFTEVRDEEHLSSEKLQRLGWSYRPLEETLVDSVESIKEAGLLN
ncbi:NAD-dependent epimerase/dehydratase [Dillenia turbinata]|uniref:NAD-dependent epimerase/dehydratase n=1 Tax=Dillenia turbinata TaxID=194707 RepID=A0AAN8VRZ1_9MAGN